MPDAFAEFTRKFFALKNRPGVRLHPIPFTRAIYRGRRRGLCPHSFPTEKWLNLVIEQIVVDSSGMQPRFLKNDKSWLEQPAIYCECYQVVQEARKVADDWKEAREDKPDQSIHGL